MNNLVIFIVFILLCSFTKKNNIEKFSFCNNLNNKKKKKCKKESKKFNKLKKEISKLNKKIIKLKQEISKLNNQSYINSDVNVIDNRQTNKFSWE